MDPDVEKCIAKLDPDLVARIRHASKTVFYRIIKKLEEINFKGEKYRFLHQQSINSMSNILQDFIIFMQEFCSVNVNYQCLFWSILTSPLEVKSKEEKYQEMLIHSNRMRDEAMKIMEMRKKQ